MKRVFAIFLFSLFAAVAVQAQKFALIDMEYILKNIPAYERANEQMAQQSKRWQGEIDELAAEAESLYKKYQSESAFLSDEQRNSDFGKNMASSLESLSTKINEAQKNVGSFKTT